MTRLRRSLRGGAPEPLTKEDRFEKLISYVGEVDSGKREHTILRQLSMPSYILSSAREVLKSKAAPSMLELLPTDFLLDVVTKLEGNDQIMLALSCKTLSSIVEASDTRKIANLTDYCGSLKRPYQLVAAGDGSNDAEFLKLGYQRPPRRPEDPQEARHYHHSELSAADDQVSDLRNRMVAYLGPGYAWCERCRIFRLLKQKWWKEFAEYESAGALKQSKAATKKLKDAVDEWQKEKNEDQYWAVRKCPAHAILQEKKGGKRAMLEGPEPKPKKDKPAKKTTKGKGKRRRADTDTEDDSDEDD